jgi:ribosomal protein S18 acetylase RimI-like enzyme
MTPPLPFSVTEIPDLYRITPKDFTRTCAMLGEAFQKDPIWCQILKNEPTKFPLVFGMPVMYTLKYGKIYAPTQDISAAAVWLATPFVEMTPWRMFRSGAYPVAMKLGAQIGKQISKVFSIIEKDRKTILRPPYIYLSVLGVSSTQQGKGLGTFLVKKMIENLPPKIPLYLETETASNVKFYERLGFHVMKEFQVPVLNLPMWEMIHDGK